MKISTKGRYALWIMLDLALYSKGENVSIKTISERQNISEKYLEQIITLLNKSGYVKSVRGSNGGYQLTKQPKDYTVGMILRCAEGSLSPVACVEDDSFCEKEDKCVTSFVWKEIAKAISNVVDSITLEDLVEKQHKIDSDFQ